MQTLLTPANPAPIAAHDKANLITLAARRRREGESNPHQRLVLTAHESLPAPRSRSAALPIWSAIND